MLPKETLLQLLPFVDNPKEELESWRRRKQVKGWNPWDVPEPGSGLSRPVKPD
ncbi:MAG: hypothetical protein ACLTW9_04260 [Enterocloster sp.]